MPDEIQLLAGDARHIPLPDASVQCIVTSPPYWGLRKYAGQQELDWSTIDGKRPDGKRVTSGLQLECKESGHVWEAAGEIVRRPDRSTIGKDANGAGIFGDERGVQDAKNARGGTLALGNTCRRCGAWRGAFGLEPTIELYVAHSIEILRELRRVLRPDGVLFWNIGDSYAGGGGFSANAPSATQSKSGQYGLQGALKRGGAKPMGQLKPKDLCLIPERIAIAAQNDGWWVRSRIMWCKPNPMPESVTDRPTDAAEHIWMFTKSERYFWDAEAVREAAGENTHSRGNGNGGPKAEQRARDGVHQDWAEKTREVLTSRNLRNVWNFPTQPYAGAHFATFPEEIPRRAIRAASSACGCCAQCGAPWERVTRQKSYGAWHDHADDLKHGQRNTTGITGEKFYETYHPPQTIGWRPTCICRRQRGATLPCIVLDPFGGSGTTGKVAIELGRRAVLVDLAYGEPGGYRELAQERTTGVQRPLLV